MLQTANSITMLQNKYRAVLRRMRLSGGALLLASLLLTPAPFMTHLPAEAADLGTLIKDGSGTLLLNNAANDFTEGTKIESGTLNIADSASYGQANKGDGSKAGYITFTGADQSGPNMTAQ